MTTMTTTRAMWLRAGRAGALLWSGQRCAASDGVATQGASSQGNTLVDDGPARDGALPRSRPKRTRRAGRRPTACVSGPEEGAMGVHFIKGAILFDGAINPQEPEALIYEIKRRPGPPRRRRVHRHRRRSGTPEQRGRAAGRSWASRRNLVGAPEPLRPRPAFYELHVWAFRPNVKGTFVDWNPAVSCAGFEPTETPTAAAHHPRPALVAPGPASPSTHSEDTPVNAVPLAWSTRTALTARREGRHRPSRRPHLRRRARRLERDDRSPAGRRSCAASTTPTWSRRIRLRARQRDLADLDPRRRSSTSPAPRSATAA